MSDPRELLSLLSCKVQRFDVSPGGIAAITPEDVAYILGTIKDPKVTLYARIIGAKENQFSGELVELMREQLWKEVENISKWRNGPDWQLNLCRLALAEAVHPHTCSWCRGVAAVTTEDGQVITCDGCKGTGKRTMRDSDRAMLMGISKQAWSDHWSDRYNLVRNITVDRYESIIGGAINKRRG